MKKKIYVSLIILFLYILFLKFVLIDNNLFYKPVIFITFPLIAFIFYNIFGYQKERNVNKCQSIIITILVLLSYLFINFLSGIFFGFNKSPFNTSLLGILSNVYYLISLIFSEEIIRYIIIKKCSKEKAPIILITLIFILFDVFLMYTNTFSKYEIFLLITTSVLPSISRNIIATCLCYQISYVPGLLIRMFFGVYNYVFKIYPNTGYYLISVSGLVIPFLIYIFNFKYIKLSKNNIKLKNTKKHNFIYSVITLILIALISSLVSGFFKYQIIAIGSGSMSPNINYGDAVLFKHINENEINTLKKGDILVFYHDKKYITHRIVKKYNDNINIKFQTKGDNNKTQDNFIVNENDVVGKVIFKIRYIGNPTLWLNKIFNKM